MSPRWLAVALLALAACHHSGPTSADAGPAAGADAAAAAGPDASFICLPLGVDGGALYPLAALADLCQAEVRGEHNQMLSFYTQCGAPYTVEDEKHIDSNDNPTACSVGSQAQAFNLAEQRMAAGQLVFQRANMVACEQAGAQDGGLLWDDGGVMIAPCANLLVGTVAVGGACDDSSECVAPAYCKQGSTTSCSGTCTAPLAQAVPCEPSTDACGAGLLCRQSGSTWQCLAPAAAGEWAGESSDCASGLVWNSSSGACELGAPEGTPCDDTVRCATTLYCQLAALGSTQQVCRKPAALGGECGTGIDCDNEGCTTACNATSSRCEAMGTLGSPCGTGHVACTQGYFCSAGKCAVQARQGEACVVGDGLPAPRGSCMWPDTFCKRSQADPVHGACAWGPKLCEPCGDGPDVSPACQEGVCDSGRALCVWFPQLGEACEEDDRPCDYGLTCQLSGSAYRCAPLPALGQPCADNDSCAPGLYCGSLAGGDRTCAALVADGQPCVSIVQCATGTCSAADQRCHEQCQGVEGCGGYGGVGFFVFFAGLGTALWRGGRRREGR